MIRMTSIVAALVAATFVGLAAKDVSADCAQPPVAVPGLSGPPVWLPPTVGSTAWRAQLEDPRWAGGSVHSFSFIGPGGTAMDQFDAQYRFVDDV